jgi:hypothetical protein
MTTAAYTWPLTLPASPVVNSYQESFKDNVIRSQIDAGPMKTRQRYTRIQRLIQVTFMLTDSQKATFTTFFSTIKGGALPYNWADPVSGTSIVVRMTGAVNGPGYINKNLWQVSFEVEVLP